jgi:glycosyltransferase involved in cell wall biosynthesis
MKILFFSTVHPSPGAPTRGTFNKVLLDALRTAGHDVRAIVPVPWHERPSGKGNDNPHVLAVRFWYPPRILRRGLHRFLWLSVRSAVRRTTAAWHPDVVLGYWTHPDGTVALRIAEELGIPGCVMTGGTDVNSLAGEPDRRELIKATLRRADRVIAIGDALRSKVAELGVDPSRLHTFRRGVNREQFRPGDRHTARLALELDLETPILLWIGRMVQVKGLDVLLEAFAGIVTSPLPHLYLVGDGPLRSALRSHAERLGILARVHFTGPVSHETLGEWYRAADTFVLPSLSEGMPNVLLESMACGTPFVASRVGNIAELAEDDGWVVPPGNVEALQSALNARLASPVIVHGSAIDDSAAAKHLADILEDAVAERVV